MYISQQVIVVARVYDFVYIETTTQFVLNFCEMKVWSSWWTERTYPSETQDLWPGFLTACWTMNRENTDGYNISLQQHRSITCIIHPDRFSVTAILQLCGSTHETTTNYSCVVTHPASCLFTDISLYARRNRKLAQMLPLFIQGYRVFYLSNWCTIKLL
jgi:hypothetical protein